MRNTLSRGRRTKMLLLVNVITLDAKVYPSPKDTPWHFREVHAHLKGIRLPCLGGVWVAIPLGRAIQFTDEEWETVFAWVDDMADFVVEYPRRRGRPRRGTPAPPPRPEIIR